MKVTVEYTFTLIAGRGASRVETLAKEAKDIATEYFGSDNGLTVVMEVQGKQVQKGKALDSDNLYVGVVAAMEVEV